MAVGAALAAAVALLAAVVPTPLIAAPAGAATSGCNVRSYGIDPDPDGLNVRATPSKSGRVIGKLFSSPDEETNQSTGPWFTMTGFSTGWVKLRDADPTTIVVDSTTEQKNFQGVGWVSASRVTMSLNTPADEAYFTKREHKAYATPSFQAKVVEDWATTNARFQYENLGTDPLILDCTGRWAKLRYRISGYIDRTGEWTPYERGDEEYGRSVTAWVYGETK
jgi:hypothetical protein